MMWYGYYELSSTFTSAPQVTGGGDLLFEHGTQDGAIQHVAAKLNHAIPDGGAALVTLFELSGCSFHIRHSKEERMNELRDITDEFQGQAISTQCYVLVMKPERRVEILINVNTDTSPMALLPLGFWNAVERIN